MMIDIDTLEQEKIALKRKIQLSRALSNLEHNKDFVTLFEMYYFNEYVLDSVAKLSTDKDNQASLYLGLEMVSQLQAELQNIKTQGAMAEQQLQELSAIPLDEYL